MACCLPALHPAYILGVKGVGPYYGQTPKTHPTLSIFTANDRQLLTTIPDLEELSGTFGRSVPLDQRVFFLPTANLLITLPTTNDEIVLRKLSIVDIRNPVLIICLWNRFRPAPLPPVKHSPTTSPRLGPWQGAISRQRPRRHEAQAQPPNGKCPPILARPTSVILTLTDASGQEVFHSFTLKVSTTTPDRKP